MLGSGGLEILELQLHLIDQAGTALRTVAVLVPTQLGDLEPEMLDHRLGRPDDCSDLHVDLSRNRSKRFCSTTCGNRMAAAAYRERRAR